MRLVRALDLAGWALTAVGAAFWLAVVEVFWLPWRVAGVLLPLSIAVAVVGNVVLPLLALRLSGSRTVAVLPAATWGVVALAAMTRRPEGDVVLAGTGGLRVVNLAFLLFGVMAAAFAAGRVLGSAPGVRQPVTGEHEGAASR